MSSSKGGDNKQGGKQDAPFNCSLCGNLYTEPRILPCGHIYCAGCLNKKFEEARSKGEENEEGRENEDAEKGQQKKKDNLDQVNNCPCPTLPCSEPIELVTGDAQQFPKSFIIEVFWFQSIIIIK